MKTFLLRSIILVNLTLCVNSFSQFIESPPYYPEEYLRYKLSLSSIVLGEAEISFNSDNRTDNTQIKVSARSVGVAKFFKDIEYTFFSYIDTESGLPEKAGRIIKEPDFTDKNMVEYFHDHWDDSSAVYSRNTDTLKVPKGIYDILTGFYTFRANYLDKDMSDYKTTEITTFFIDEIWDLVLRYDGTEMVTSILGEQKCYKIMPRTEISRYFRTHDDMSIWFTKENYIPVKILVKMKFGSLIANLVEYSPPEY